MQPRFPQSAVVKSSRHALAVTQVSAFVFFFLSTECLLFSLSTESLLVSAFVFFSLRSEPTVPVNRACTAAATKQEVEGLVNLATLVNAATFFAIGCSKVLSSRSSSCSSVTRASSI